MTSKMNIGTPTEVRLHISGRKQSNVYRQNCLQMKWKLFIQMVRPEAAGQKKRVKEIVSICSIFVPREAVQYQVEYLETGNRKK